MSYKDLYELFSVARIREYSTRQFLCKQGEFANSFYILLSGEVGVYAEIEDDMFQIDKIRSGCFGEIALLLDRKRTAFIATKEDNTRVLELSRAAFNIFCQRMPNFASDIAKMVIERMVDQDKTVIQKLRPTLQERDSITITSLKRLLVEPVFGEPDLDRDYNTDIFMVMPYQDSLNNIYEYNIKKTAEELGLKIRRADDFFSKHAIITEIWSVTFQSKLVIVDCTGKNPNVFYELGIAHTLGRPVILIAQNEEDIPFDIRHQRYILYDMTMEGRKKLESNLQDAIRKLLKL
jgi:CRP-like cAMP-binding protein